MRSTAVFSVALLSAFYLEGRLSASECAARAPITASSLAVQVYRTVPLTNDTTAAAATVTLIRAGRTVRTVETDKRGFARITPPPGRYSVWVSTSGTHAFTQDVIIGVKGVGSPRVLAVLPWGECGVACEVPGKPALAKPPDCLFAPRTTRD